MLDVDISSPVDDARVTTAADIAWRVAGAGTPVTFTGDGVERYRAMFAGSFRRRRSFTSSCRRCDAGLAMGAKASA